MLSFSDIQQIVTNPVQAVSDAVDEVASLLNKFHGTKRDNMHVTCFNGVEADVIITDSYFWASRMCT